MARELKVGDRVRIAGNPPDICATDARLHGMTGTVVEILNGFKSGYDVVVKFDHSKDRYGCARRQLTPLKKKERRRVWVQDEFFTAIGEKPINVRTTRPKICKYGDPSWCDEECFEPGWTEFVEVRKREGKK